jgi:ATP-dependent Clp protease ATP-binding subunit ClpA
MTSNAGSHNKENLMGFGKTEAESSKEKAISALEEFLRPEFIARIDEIIAFSKLSSDSMVKIAELMLSDLKRVIEEKGIVFTFDQEVCKFIADISKNGKSGARDLRNNIRKKIEDNVVDIIISNGEDCLSEINVTVQEDKLKFSKK